MRRQGPGLEPEACLFDRGGLITAGALRGARVLGVEQQVRGGAGTGLLEQQPGSLEVLGCLARERVLGRGR